MNHCCAFSALVFCLLGGGQPPAFALQSQDDLGREFHIGWRMEAELEQCDYDVECAWRRGFEMQQRPAYRRDCDSTLLADFLMMHARMRWGGQLDANEYRKAACGVRGAPLWYAFGHLALMEDDLDSARVCFEQALMDARQKGLYIEYSAAQALGAVCNAMGDFPVSLQAFEHAHSLDPLRNSPNDMNNFAHLNLVMGDCEAALQWLDLAEVERERLTAESKSNASAHENMRNVLLLTRIQVARATRSLDVAAELLKLLDFSKSFVGRELVAAHVITSFCIERNDRLLFEGFQPRLQEFIAQADSVDALEQLGPCALLFEPWTGGDWEANWERLRSLPHLIRGGMDGVCASEAEVILERNGAESSRPWRAATALGLLPMLGLGVVFIRGRLRHRELGELEAQSASAWRSEVDACLNTDPSGLRRSQRLRMARALAHLLDRSVEQSVAQLPGWESCSVLERQLALGLAQGIQTKQMAVRLGITTSYAYNLRSQVRLKLNVPDSESLDSWLQSHVQ
jgi:DNA-binding CsgD family transcriptional regulator/tetratricopeptide (TPR) repeat protein